MYVNFSTGSNHSFDVGLESYLTKTYSVKTLYNKTGSSGNSVQSFFHFDTFIFDPASVEFLLDVRTYANAI